MANFLDNFNGSAGTLSGRVADTGQTWVNITGQNVWQVANGNLQFPLQTGYMVVVDTGMTSFTLVVQWNYWNAGDGLLLRFVDFNNYLMLVRDAAQVTLRKCVAGVTSDVTSWPYVSADYVAMTLTVVVAGADYDLTLDSTNQLHQTFTEATFSTATQIGVQANSAQSNMEMISASAPIFPADMSGTAQLGQGGSGTLESASIAYTDLDGQLDLLMGSTGTLSALISFDVVLDLGFTADDPVVYSGAQSAGNGPRPDAPDRLVLSLGFSVRYSLDYPLAPSLAGGTALTRGMLGVAADVQTPTVISGRPVISPFWGIEDSVSSVTGIQIIPEPDPPPLPPKKPSDPDPIMHRWLSKDQPLNDQWIEAWPEHGGGATWRSQFPFRPKLKAHIHYGAKGKKFIHSNAVFFNPAYVEHMWLDMGHALVQPYTWLFAVIILGYPAGDYRQYLLDSGKPTGGSTIAKVRRGYNINDGLSYRNTLLADRKQLIVGTQNGGSVARAPHHYAPRPRVFGGVYNGSNSYAAVMDEKTAKIVKGKVPTTKPRYFVSGRKQGRIDTDDAAHFMIFEIRLIEHAALSPTELRKHYKQLASKYKFNSY